MPHQDLTPEDKAAILALPSGAQLEFLRSFDAQQKQAHAEAQQGDILSTAEAGVPGGPTVPASAAPAPSRPSLTAPEDPERATKVMQAIDAKDAQALQLLRPELSPDQISQLLTGEETLTTQFVEPVAAPAASVAATVAGTELGGPTAGIAAGVAVFGPAQEAVSALRTLEQELKGFGRPEELLAPSLERVRLSMLRALAGSKEDAAFTLGILSVGRGAGAILKSFGKSIGLTSAGVADALRQARNAGMEGTISATNLNLRFVDIVNKALLAVPILGGVARKGSSAALLKVAQRQEEILSMMGHGIDLGQLSKNLSKEALAAHGALRNKAFVDYSVLYKTLKRAGDPAAIPTTSFKSRIEVVLGGSTKGLPKTGKGEIAGQFKPEISPQLRAELERLLEIGPFLTGTEFRAVQRNLNRKMRLDSRGVANAGDFSALQSIGKGMKNDLDNIDMSVVLGGTNNPQIGELIKRQIKRANQSWVDYKALEETAAAYPLLKLSPGFFKSGFKSGMVQRQLDDLADAYLDAASIGRSKEYIESISTLFGEQNKKDLARTIVSRAFKSQTAVIKGTVKRKGAELSEVDRLKLFPEAEDKIVMGSTEVQMLNAGAALKNLGLDAADPASRKFNREALEQLLKGTDLNVSVLQDFLRTAKRIQKSPGSDPAAFLTRRIVLGGTVVPKGITGLFKGASAEGTGGVAAAGGAAGAMPLVTLGIFVMTTRAFSKLIATPKGIRLLMDGLRPGATRTAEQAAILARRLNAELSQSEPSEATPDSSAIINLGVSVHETGLNAINDLNERLPGLMEGLGKAGEALGKSIPENLGDVFE